MVRVLPAPTATEPLPLRLRLPAAASPLAVTVHGVLTTAATFSFGEAGRPPPLGDQVAAAQSPSAPAFHVSVPAMGQV
ncbi:MAG: hypothetical protein FJ290_19755 [Planctomycetes bacterium]|nr:hypothetical protein [Planctomycetota bacterium]